MRVTFNMRGMQMKDMLSTSLSNYTEAVKKANAQKSLLNPWEDTSKYVGAYNVLNMIDELTQFSENANSASNWLNNTNAELQELLEALKKARDDYAIAGASDSYDEESRKALAQDVLSLYNQIMDIANASYNGRYIFGGFQTGKPPFTGGTNSVTNVVTKNENGENLSGDAIVKDVFSDMTELKSGKYTAKMVVDNNTGIAKLQLYDEKGNVVIMDSNGSDEAGGSGNKSAVSMTFEYEPGKVINTGRGISFKLPDDLENPTSIVMEFDYKSGSEITYQGDNGYIYTQIGYSQDIAVNMPGSNIFTQSSLILQGSAFNTVNGMAATINSLFSNLDNTNISIGDSIEIAGTDHNGNKVGIASLVSNTNPSLDLASATEKERTLTITYGDKLYKIVVPQKAYSSTDELANAINHELKNAEYIGSIGSLSGMNATIDDYASTVNSQVNSGKFQGEITTEGKNKYKVDLSSEIKISADGDRLNFMSQKTGDNVRIAVTGTDQSLLGFKGATVAAEGKDTTFEIGYDFHTDTINPVETTHKNFDLNGTSYTFFVNGKEITVNKPATQTTTTNITNQILGGVDANNQPNDIELQIAGKTIKIPATEFDGAIAAGTTPQDFLNEKLREYGLGGEAAVTNVIDNGDGTYNFDVSTTTPTKKDIEYAFDEALRKAGFDFGVGVSLDLNPNDPANLGNYDITFSLQNYNMDRDTTLTTTAYDRTTIPPTSDMQTAKLDRSRLNDAEEKTLGDYVKFIEDLYGQTVDVSIVDGKLTIADLRSGDSKLTFRTNALNQGISHANDQMTIVGGAYSGKKDDTWNVSVTTTLGQNDQRNISIVIMDKNGNTIYNKVTNDYKGGPIELPNGVTITPDDMEIPNPLDPTKRESTTTFQLDLKAQPGLNFGDVNIKETGKNVNVFRALENLMHALEYNITKNGFGEPSAWKATDLNSTAKPFLDGVFQGNFNDNWKYEILSANQKTDFYLQNEYKTTSGQVQYDAQAYANNPVLKFSVDMFDNKTGKVERKDVEIDLSKANPPITNAESAQEYILKQLNNDPDFVEAGIRFANKDGSIEIQSGSGTKIANFANSATNPAERAFASFVMGFDTVANGTLPDTFTAAFTFRVADPLDPAGSSFKEITIDPVVNENITNITVSASETFALTVNGHTVDIPSEEFMAAADKDAFINEKLKEAGISIDEGATAVTPNPNGTYNFQITAFSSKEDVLAKINAALDDAATGTDGRIKANIAADGSIQFVTSSTDLPVEASVAAGAGNPLGLGLTYDGATGNVAELTVSGVQTPKTDLSELSEDARTLTITYYDENTNEQKEVKVTLDKKEYKSTQEMVEHINEQLTGKGIAAGDLSAVVNSKGEIGFTKTNGNFSSIVVEGDYAGTLGFPKAGDSVSVKVTNAEGGLVQNVTLDTANKSVFVSDGLHLGFDAGTLSATDSFTAAVGSGVENEIDTLDAAVNQVLQAGTLIGTRGQRVESVIKFQETVIKNNEEIKAGYLGATATDIIKLTTDLELSKTAYQSAVSIVTSMMSISILDFLG